MNKLEMLYAVHAFSVLQEIPHEEIVIGGGGALLLMGIRETTEDLNLWVNESQFNKLADDHGLYIKNKRNRTVKVGVSTYVRVHNPYYSTWVMNTPCHPTDPNVRAEFPFYDALSMLIHKRSSHQAVERPFEKRQQDHADIKLLEEKLRVQYAVKS